MRRQFFRRRADVDADTAAHDADGSAASVRGHDADRRPAGDSDAAGCLAFGGVQLATSVRNDRSKFRSSCSAVINAWVTRFSGCEYWSKRFRISDTIMDRDRPRANAGITSPKCESLTDCSLSPNTTCYHR